VKRIRLDGNAVLDISLLFDRHGTAPTSTRERRAKENAT
jgi:hypothetical protein